MKTVEDFIQRLQNDPEFEQKAQSYENSDDFMEFLKSEGFGFTLDQLLGEFKPEQPAIEQPEPAAPAPRKTAEDFIQRLQSDPEFEEKARSFENNDDFLEFVKAEGYDFTLDQLTDGFKQNKESAALQEEVPPAPSTVMSEPVSHLPESEEMKPEPEAAPDPAGEQRPEHPKGLSPKFEGTIGGRRRAMKWQHGGPEGT